MNNNIGILDFFTNLNGIYYYNLNGQTKDYKIGICCFSAKHTLLRRKSKDWLSQNQNNVSKWSDMSTRGLLASTIKIQLSVLRVGLVQSGHHHHLIEN